MRATPSWLRHRETQKNASSSIKKLDPLGGVTQRVYGRRDPEEFADVRNA
jgi:hypothetical protein